MKTAIGIALLAVIATGQTLSVGDWPYYSGDLSGRRYSPLNQINTSNAARLRPVWMYQTNDLNQFETSPIVTGGVMYISEPPSNAAALDPKTGRPFWIFRRPLPSDLRLCCGQVNRGVAVWETRVFLGTLDAHLIALDARSGGILWDIVVADYKSGYSITAAPLVVKDKVIIGISGGEYGIRGFLDAYDVRTGKRAWRFWTVPGPGEPGSETWTGDSWKTGSAGTWVTGSYDPEVNLIFWGTGNPGPDYDGDIRAGDNLYANSLIAVDADTGKLRWAFQFTPHDTHDWDANHVPVLFETKVQGQKQKLVGVANRNGFYYVLDRKTGKFLRGAAFTKQTWARGLDSQGRPMVLPDTVPTEKGIVLYPGLHGATNYASPSFNPDLGLLFVPVREEPTTYYRATAEYRAGSYYSAGGMRGVPGIEPRGFVKALNAATGAQKWEFPLHSPPWGGLLSTAGGLVFGGTTDGSAFALDARTGKALWDFPAGGPVQSNPVAYVHNRRQYLVLAAGHSLIAFSVDVAAK